MTTENKKGKTVQNFRTNIPDDTTKHETHKYISNTMEHFVKLLMN